MTVKYPFFLTTPLYREVVIMVSFFVIFFGVHLTLEYDYMCSETDFTQENKRIGLGGKVGLL